jgi:hypothetical protein
MGKERRLAPFLTPTRLSEMLSACSSDLPDDAVRADLKSGELARWAAATCLVEELAGTPPVQQW